MKTIFTFLIFCVSGLVFAHPAKQPCFLNKGQNQSQSGNGHQGSDNQNGNSNGNANKNTNTNTNNVKVKVNVDPGGGAASTSSSSSSGNGTTPTNGNTFNYAPIDGRSYSPTSAPSVGTSPSFGGGGYTPSYAGSCYTPTTGYSTPMPTVNGPAEDPNTAWLTVDVPNEQAEVYLNGVKMPQKGLTRKYVTPPLNPRQTYNYALKVVWPDGTNGKKNYHANIELKAGDEIHHVVPNGNNNNNINNVPPMPNEGAPKKAKINDEEDRLRTLESKLQVRIKLAKELIDNGKKEKGRKWLEEIVENHPATKAAADAKFLLNKLK